MTGGSLRQHLVVCSTLVRELTDGKPLVEVKLLANLMKESLARKAAAEAEKPA